jgi:beta-lactamase regulating signal transducer with metallopeptidase domain
LEGLAFLLLHELAHIALGDLCTNLSFLHPYGDLKHQLFLFTNSYTGFDALFIDHFTNTRYTLDQEAQADLLALKLMEEIGFQRLSHEKYKELLKIIQNQDSKPDP